MSHISSKNNTFKATLISAAVIAACASSTVYAEEALVDTEENKIERIVIVGATTNTEITAEKLEAYQATDLGDIFRHTPSVTVGGSLGVAQKIYVRGMEDTMLNVTVDGAPQTSSLFHHIGRVSIEPELLQSVEVQAGAGEATAGIGAVGGAIRFETKDADDLLEKDEIFGGTVKAGYFSNDGHKESITLYGKATDTVGILASYVNVSNNDMVDGDGEIIPGTAADQTLAFVKVSAELTENQNLSLSYEKREEQGDFSKNTNWQPLETDELYASWGDRETIVLNHAWYLNDLVNLETTLYSTDSSFKRELYTWDASINTIGFDIRNTSNLGDHSLTYGVEHKNDEVHAESYGAYGGVNNEEGMVTAFYAQDHWQLTDDLVLSLGARYDAYELEHTGDVVAWEKDADGNWIATPDYSDPEAGNFSVDKQDGVSLNGGLAYSITDDLTFSAGYAQALRGRQIADAFTLGEVEHNENLEPEEVENSEVGFVYNDGTFIFEASAYLSTINDVVFDKFKGREGVFYENIGDLETAGFEFVAGYQAEDFDVLLSYNTNDVELNNTSFVWGDETVHFDGLDLEAYEYAGLGTTVGDSINLSINYDVNAQLAMGFNVNYVADVNGIEVFHRSMELGWVTELETVSKPGYTVADAYISYTPLENLTVDLSIQNLFDETYRNHGSVADYGHIDGYESVVGINEAGHDIRLAVSYNF
jgi:hemoglobin/transferrin/lactoferrin receptor protein